MLLGLVGINWAFAYIGVDLGLYLITKLVRDDIWYWLLVGGNAGLLLSILLRVCPKLITDFTSLVQLRHPQELGGVNWMFSFVIPMASLPAVIKIYEFKDCNNKNVQLV